jgi:DNA-binding LacI/PurR family transcriptional regulator
VPLTGREDASGRRITLAIIAAEAGVSLPTVSKVVNRLPDVAAATRAKVERLLDRHHYLRSGNRRQRRSGLIDLVFNGELLDLAERPTAIFAGSDQQALGVYEAARQRGLRIPQDLSVVGFDDLPVARWVSPPLTTVRQPLAEMGRAAAQMLGEILQDRPLRSRQVELSTELIMRESTGPVPGTAG